MTPVVITLIALGAIPAGISIYLFKKSKPARKEKNATEQALVYRIDSYRSRYGKRKDAQGFLDEILPDNPSRGGVGSVTARLASGDFSGAAVVGLASVATKTIVDSSMRFFRKKKIETPKSETQEKLESNIVSLVHAYNEMHFSVEQMNRTTTYTFFAALVFFFFAAGISI
jgi:hypothetical protein